jgi:hypothetical protein
MSCMITDFWWHKILHIYSIRTIIIQKKPSKSIKKKIYEQWYFQKLIYDRENTSPRPTAHGPRRTLTWRPTIWDKHGALTLSVLAHALKQILLRICPDAGDRTAAPWPETNPRGGTSPPPCPPSPIKVFASGMGGPRLHWIRSGGHWIRSGGHWLRHRCPLPLRPSTSSRGSIRAGWRRCWRWTMAPLHATASERGDDVSGTLTSLDESNGALNRRLEEAIGGGRYPLHLAIGARNSVHYTQAQEIFFLCFLFLQNRRVIWFSLGSIFKNRDMGEWIGLELMCGMLLLK